MLYLGANTLNLLCFVQVDEIARHPSDPAEALATLALLRQQAAGRGRDIVVSVLQHTDTYIPLPPCLPTPVLESTAPARAMLLLAQGPTAEIEQAPEELAPENPSPSDPSPVCPAEGASTREIEQAAADATPEEASPAHLASDDPAEGAATGVEERQRTGDEIPDLPRSTAGSSTGAEPAQAQNLLSSAPEERESGSADLPCVSGTGAPAVLSSATASREQELSRVSAVTATSHVNLAREASGPVHEVADADSPSGPSPRASTERYDEFFAAPEQREQLPERQNAAQPAEGSGYGMAMCPPEQLRLPGHDSGAHCPGPTGVPELTDAPRNGMDDGARARVADVGKGSEGVGMEGPGKSRWSAIRRARAKVVGVGRTMFRAVTKRLCCCHDAGKVLDE